MIPPILARSRGLRRLYGLLFAPLLEEYGLTQLEADILMFLANNPQWDTARDIAEFRHLAKSHVSAGIERLAARGYLERFTLPGNRKVIHLRLLPPSGPVVERGRELQDKYGRLLLDGLTEKEIALLQRLLDRIAENTDRAIALREGTECIMLTFIVCFVAGMGAGLGTGFAGMSAAAVITPMLVTFLHIEPYQAVGIALASDVLASAVSAYTYGKNRNLDVRNGLVMMVSVLAFTLAGSWVSSLVPSGAMGNFSVFMTLLLGVKFIVRPVMTTRESMEAVSKQKRLVQSVVCGMGIGFICGFIGAGGGMMMLLILTSVLGYELKTAVGTSVFIMAFTALTGSLSHFAIGGVADWWVLLLCVLSTLLWAQIAARFANKSTPEVLNRATGAVLVVLGAVILGVNYLT